MMDLQNILLIALGILVSITLPVLANIVRQFTKPPVDTHSKNKTLTRIWNLFRPYILTGLFSLVTALVLYAFYQVNLTDTQLPLSGWSAFLAGYTYDSTLQKLIGTQSN